MGLQQGTNHIDEWGISGTCYRAGLIQAIENKLQQTACRENLIQLFKCPFYLEPTGNDPVPRLWVFWMEVLWWLSWKANGVETRVTSLPDLEMWVSCVLATHLVPVLPSSVWVFRSTLNCLNVETKNKYQLPKPSTHSLINFCNKILPAPASFRLRWNQWMWKIIKVNELLFW